MVNQQHKYKQGVKFPQIINITVSIIPRELIEGLHSCRYKVPLVHCRRDTLTVLYTITTETKVIPEGHSHSRN